MTKKIFLVMAILSFTYPLLANAQQDDNPQVYTIQEGAALPEKKDVEAGRPGQQRKAQAEEERMAREAAQTTAAEAEKKIIFVKTVIIDNSEILSNVEIRKITSRVEGRNTTIKELLDIVGEINELYKNKKFITARAILPAQKVTDGIVVIRLIEGRIGKIEVKGNKYTRAPFLKDKIFMKTGDIADLLRLEKRLSFFNSTSDTRMTAEFSPGEKAGTTDCTLHVEEPQQYQASIFVDNAGRKEVGLYRIGASISDASLLGYRDHFNAGGFWAGGTFAGSVSYDCPVGPLGTRLGTSYDFNQVAVNSGPFQVLDIGTNFYDFGVKASQPLIGTPVFKLNAFAGYDYKKSVTEFSGVKLFVNRVSCISNGVDFQAYDQYGGWFSREYFTEGFESLGSDKNYFKFNGDIVRVVALKDDATFILRFGGQISDTRLLPSTEQFQIGGSSTVRGYSEGLLAGDSGYVANAELNFPLPYTKGTFLEKMFKAVLFADHGGAFPFKPNNESINSNDFLTSVGFGALINLTKYFSGKVNFGIPLTNRENTQGTPVLHFYVQCNLL